MASPLDIEIAGMTGGWMKAGFDPAAEARRAALAAIAMTPPPAGLDPGRALEMSVLLADDGRVRTLNRDFRGKDKPTNVLSFATLDGEDAAMLLSLPGPFHLGDLALALETLQGEAAAQGKAVKDHFLHLIVHGTLHLMGYDHIEPAEAETMEALEIAILGSLGVENPYQDQVLMQE